MDKIARHIGVYGIATVDGKLVAIRRQTGPYRNRYDLPGGTVKPGEPLSEALEREFLEETGFRIMITRNLGLFDFLVRWPHSGHEFIHHLAGLYTVTFADSTPLMCRGNHEWISEDSAGLYFLDLEDTGAGYITPLVRKAKELFETGELSERQVRCLDWVVKED